jgi:pimeloyl-ACP methyl ester carboxylesterase
MAVDSTSTTTEKMACPSVISGFATTDDGVQLHWRMVGSGPLLVCNNGVGVSTFFWKYLTEHFRSSHRVLLWDYRAHGRSQRVLDPGSADMSVNRHARDLLCILDHLEEVEPCVLIGHSMGCQVALEVLRLAPDRARGMVMALGTAGRALHTFYDFKYSWILFRAAERAIGGLGEISNQFARPLLRSPLAWGMSTRLKLVDPYYMQEQDLRPYLDHLASLDLPLFFKNVIETDRHDCWDILPELKIPVLVIAAENDKITPMWCSRKIVQTIPRAEILVLADASHAALVEQPETINCRVARYLGQLGDQLPRRSVSDLKRDTVSGSVRSTSERTILLGTK